MSDLLNPELFSASVRLTTPLLLAALGALIVWRAGIINLAIEGFMLIGALSSTIGAIWSGSTAAGLLIAVLVCVAFGAAMAVAIVIYGANQIVVGIAFNMGAIGLTDYVASVAPQMLGTNSLRVATVPNIRIPRLAEIPWIGEALFQQSILFYVAIGAAILMWFVLYRTGAGIAVRAVGENARAADTAGVSVARIRFVTYLLSCAFAGLAGAFLSIGYLGSFISGMSAGQGYIALVVVILGQWNPLGTVVASALFGYAQALTVRWPSSNMLFPIEIIASFPYVLTLVVVTLVGKAKGPAEEGIQYYRAG
ncbi:MAG TPA: ABC transporter permease [Bauldia sp.]|nr:ABC transporter permease [Bauldia sp.]